MMNCLSKNEIYISQFINFIEYHVVNERMNSKQVVETSLIHLKKNNPFMIKKYLEDIFTKWCKSMNHKYTAKITLTKLATGCNDVTFPDYCPNQSFWIKKYGQNFKGRIDCVWIPPHMFSKTGDR